MRAGLLATAAVVVVAGCKAPEAASPPAPPATATAEPTSAPPPPPAAKPPAAASTAPPPPKPPAPPDPDPGVVCKTTDANFAVPVAYTPTVEGRIEPSIIRRVVMRQNACFRRCYQRGLAEDRELKGKVLARFVIAAGTGVVKVVEDAGSELPDPRVVHCVLRELKGLTFPAPNKDVTIVYPLLFASAE